MSTPTHGHPFTVPLNVAKVSIITNSFLTSCSLFFLQSSTRAPRQSLSLSLPPSAVIPPSVCSPLPAALCHNPSLSLPALLPFAALHSPALPVSLSLLLPIPLSLLATPFLALPYTPSPLNHFLSLLIISLTPCRCSLFIPCYPSLSPLPCHPLP